MLEILSQSANLHGWLLKWKKKKRYNFCVGSCKKKTIAA